MITHDPRFKPWLLACALLGAAGCASSPPKLEVSHVQKKPYPHFELPGPGPYTWNCDVPNAQFKQIYLPESGRDFLVTGNIHLLSTRLMTGPKWGPAITVGFRGNTGSPVALQLFAYPSDLTTFSVGIRDDAFSPVATVFEEQENKESDMPFTLKLESGVMFATFDGLSARSTTLRPDSSQVFLSCSGAHVIFSKLAVTVGK